MKKPTLRLEKLEDRIHVSKEPVFIDWAGNPWTEEEKAGVLKKHPDRRIFWKCLSSTLPYEEKCRRERDGEPLDAPWSDVM